MPARRPPLFADPPYLAALFAAVPVVLLLASVTPMRLTLHWPGWVAVVLGTAISPVLEEIVFRAGLQDALAARTAYRVGPLTLANGLTALVFCLLHLWQHPPAWALATGLPALVFGWAYERHDRLAAPILLHTVYNTVYLFVLLPA